jgi:dihydrolipoamide dehydrogenase
MYDLTIIGAGWAGYSAAILAKKYGLNVCLIEKDKLGGVCLNYGCIPTKILFHTTRLFSQIKKSKEFGIEVEDPIINFKEIKERKERVIQRLKNGMLSEIKRKGIEFIEGRAEIITPHRIKVDSKEIETKYLLVATGSKSKELDSLKFDHKKVLDSNDILELETLPKSLLIVGGGVIGCEFAAIFKNLGTDVSIVEITDQLLPGEDREIAKRLESIFKKKKIGVFLQKDASNFDLDDFEKILVCVGRIPNIEGLEEIGVKIEKGRIYTDDYLKTSVSSIFAAGDCIGRYLLAGVASYEGRIAVENILEKEKKANYSGIPNCIFTDPEIASVGFTEEKARTSGFEIEIFKFDFLGMGASHICGDTEGLIKIIIDKNTDLILGAHIIGTMATEIINILASSIRSKIKSSQLKDSIFGHPTFSEAISEALWR